MTRRLIHLDDALVHDYIERQAWERMLSDDYIRWVMEGGDVVLVWSPELGPNGRPGDVELHTPDETTDAGIVEAIRRAALAVGLLGGHDEPDGVVPSWAKYSSQWNHDEVDGSWARVHRWASGAVAVEAIEVISAGGSRRIRDIGLVPGEHVERLERTGDLTGYAASLRAAADILDRVVAEVDR